MEKMQVTSVAELVQAAVKIGLLKPDIWTISQDMQPHYIELKWYRISPPMRVYCGCERVWRLIDGG